MKRATKKKKAETPAESPRDIDVKLYEEHSSPVWWCPGCGDFGVLKAIKLALVDLQIAPKDVALITGIGCSGKLDVYMNGNSFRGTHGRLLPIATGVQLANRDLTVIGMGGDGDGYAIGLGHVPHGIRRNIDMTYIVMNNQIYGLTKGQVSPTSDLSLETTTTPEGNTEGAINPLAIALASGATFVARAFAANQQQQVEIMKAGIRHKGFALIDIFSPCVTYNKVNTYQWYRENTYDLAEAGHDPNNFEHALKAVYRADKLALGVIYQAQRPTFERARPGATDEAMVKLPLDGQDLGFLIEEFA